MYGQGRTAPTAAPDWQAMVVGNGGTLLTECKLADGALWTPAAIGSGTDPLSCAEASTRIVQ